ncbi:hypothetical protein C8R44DRAFT_881809 [Mycena epipterygia]|nr:hypothetical protein C8R44DRAFT_881809 [Mycena epipterygia]
MSLSHPHPPGCLCSSCHLTSKLFPRGPNDRIIVPAIHPTPDNTPKSPLGNDRARFALPRLQSAPHPYRPRQREPPVPSPPRGYDDHSRRSMDAHRPPFMHRPVPPHVSAPHISDSVCADTASRGATMNGTAFTHALPHGDTSNTAEIDGSMHTSLDRNTRITIYGAVITNTETTNLILHMKEVKEATEARAVERTAMVALAREINFKFTSPAKLLSTSTTEVEIGIWSSWWTW